MGVISLNFGEILKELLETKEITQKQLAEDLNLAPTTLGNYIRGEREPDFQILKKLAMYFNVSTDYLLDFRNNEKIYGHCEDELLRIYRSMSDEYKALLLEEGRVMLKHCNKFK